MAFAGLTSICCGIIGISYFGISLKLEHKTSLESPKNFNPILQALPELVADTPQHATFADAGKTDCDFFVINYD